MERDYQNETDGKKVGQDRHFRSVHRSILPKKVIIEQSGTRGKYCSWCAAHITPVEAGGTMKNITPAIDQPPSPPDKPKRISTKVRTARRGRLARGFAAVTGAH
jgi:hypothetical protein